MRVPKREDRAALRGDMTEQSLVPVERIEREIVVLRGHKVMLDDALAKLYGVPVKALNQAVKRNIDRFPDDFMFQLSPDEASFKVTSCGFKRGWARPALRELMTPSPSPSGALDLRAPPSELVR